MNKQLETAKKDREKLDELKTLVETGKKELEVNTSRLKATEQECNNKDLHIKYLEKEIQDLKDNQKDTERYLKSKEREVQEIHAELEIVTAELREVQIEKTRLEQENTDLMSHKNNSQKLKYFARRNEEHNRMIEEKVNLEKKYNKCKREHDKAVDLLQENISIINESYNLIKEWKEGKVSELEALNGISELINLCNSKDEVLKDIKNQPTPKKTHNFNNQVKDLALSLTDIMSEKNSQTTEPRFKHSQTVNIGLSRSLSQNENKNPYKPSTNQGRGKY